MADADQKGSITIGEGVTVHGTVVATGRALVYGSLDGDVTASEVVIGPDGRVAGRLTAEVVDIYGDGPQEVTAYKSLTVRASGRVSGTIQYARLEVEPGGELDGELVPLTDAALAAAGFPAAMPGTPS
jgi:cytoskeletal protein CcmA (bactofilin family)